MDCAGLLVPITWSPKTKLVGDKVALGPESPPTPFMESTCGLPTPSSAIVIEALRWPNWLGAKVTFRVQLTPAPRLEPQVLLRSKSVALVPVIAKLLIASSEPPVLVSVSTCWPLSVPTNHTPKPRLAGARFRVGGVGGGDEGDPPPQPPNKDNPPNTSAKCFFTVSPVGRVTVHHLAVFRAPVAQGSRPLRVCPENAESAES